uniref:hypothetical protein n=1 Tax=Phaeodactylibacter xiamenensis TaxID=1524460 RepID=UPI0024A7AFBC
EAYEKGLVSVSKDKWKKNIFKLKVPRYLLSGNLSPEGASRFAGLRLDAEVRQAEQTRGNKQVVNGPATVQPSVQLSPSVAIR